MGNWETQIASSNGDGEITRASGEDIEIPLMLRHALTKCGTKLISLVIKALQFLE